MGVELETISPGDGMYHLPTTLYFQYF